MSVLLSYGIRKAGSAVFCFAACALTPVKNGFCFTRPRIRIAAYLPALSTLRTPSTFSILEITLLRCSMLLTVIVTVTARRPSVV